MAPPVYKDAYLVQSVLLPLTSALLADGKFCLLMIGLRVKATCCLSIRVFEVDFTVQTARLVIIIGYFQVT
jgi:hypothetical protein